ncbi:39S ribosomal protein L20, mitochondrial isoform X1 [Chanodichthys erythropterus]|uniref:39S ribosomal protein L20, mitochondrial isoform X1 n=1 Tax=Chanodichthys erythropterus TaxID=933992 RepID=UPI00351EA55B
MVFLTLSCWIRNRGPDRYWKVQELLKNARHFRGRKNRCYSLAVRAVRRAFIYASKARKAKRRNMRQLWISRIAAASREHHMKYPALVHNLLKRPAEQACAVRPVNHRAALFPRAGQTRARAPAGGVQSRAGRRERAAGGFLPHHTAVLTDESLCSCK